MDKLKDLQSRRKEQNCELNNLCTQMITLEDTIAAKERQIDATDAEIREMLTATPRELLISDHAIVRYLEVVYQLDLEDVKRSMVPNVIADMIQHAGDGEYGNTVLASSYDWIAHDNWVNQRERFKRVPIKVVVRGNVVVDIKQ